MFNITLLSMLACPLGLKYGKVISFVCFQVRDEYRTDYDGGRGGYGKIIAQKIAPSPMER